VVLSEDACFGKKPLEVRTDTSEEVPRNENSRPLQLESLVAGTFAERKGVRGGKVLWCRTFAENNLSPKTCIDIDSTVHRNSRRQSVWSCTRVSFGVRLTRLARSSRALQDAHTFHDVFARILDRSEFCRSRPDQKRTKRRWTCRRGALANVSDESRYAHTSSCLVKTGLTRCGTS